jgi:hypothetical protein
MIEFLFPWLLLLLLAAPFFGLGFYRSWKVAGAFFLGFALLAALYAYGQATAAPDDVIAHEWGAQFAPVFFGFLAIVVAIGVALGFGTRRIIERRRNGTRPPNEGVHQ